MPGETVYFLVEKYVLPKFQVEVDHPKTVYFEEESVQLKVCGKYSYGKNVNGYGLIKVIDSHSNMQTLYKTKRVSYSFVLWPNLNTLSFSLLTAVQTL